MKLSIIIPAHNEAAFIGKCLDAAIKATKGTETEIIVVNNGSTDDTETIVKKYPEVILLNEPRKGTNQARQTGLDRAANELVANVDADNLISEKWVVKAFQAFEKDPKLVGLSGPYLFHNLTGLANFLVKIYYWLAYPVYVLGNKHKTGGAIMGGNLVFKKSALLAAGGYNTDLKFHGDDTDTANRLNKVGKVIFDYKFTVNSSIRRIKKHGLLKTGFIYFINYIWVALFNKPYHS